MNKWLKERLSEKIQSIERIRQVRFPWHQREIKLEVEKMKKKPVFRVRAQFWQEKKMFRGEAVHKTLWGAVEEAKRRLLKKMRRSKDRKKSKIRKFRKKK